MFTRSHLNPLGAFRQTAAATIRSVRQGVLKHPLLDLMVSRKPFGCWHIPRTTGPTVFQDRPRECQKRSFDEIAGQAARLGSERIPG